MNHPRHTRYLAHFAFWLATLLMISVLAWTLYDQSTSEESSSEWVTHTYDVLLQLGQVNEELTDADSAERNYMLSADAAYLPTRAAAMEKISGTVAEVRRLTIDNAAQQVRVSQLEELIAARIALMQQDTRLRQSQGTELSQAFLATGVLEDASDRISNQVAKMRHEEQRLLDFRTAKVAHDRQTSLGTLVGAVMLGVIILIPGYLGFILQARALKHTERKLRVMADSLPGAMYQLKIAPGAKPRLTFISAGVRNLRDSDALAPDAPLEWDAIESAIDARDRAEFDAAMAEAIASASAFACDYRVAHADGSLRWLHHEASVLKDNNGSILVNGYIRDVSDKRRLNDAVQEAKEAAISANRAKSTFLATMSHEIRTPMNGMLGMLELLSITRLDPEQLLTLGIVRSSSKSLLRIIDDILDFSKIEAGKLDVRPEIVSIREVFEHIHGIYSANASSIGLLMKRSVDPLISPAVMVDPLRLRQILNNFVSNALKFTSTGSIEIKAELIERINGEDQIRFSVSDTGVGISAQDQEQLFEPFSQVDHNQARRAAGTGLGLTICRRLATLMGGTVTVVSELGHGTTISLTLLLPIANPEGLPQREPELARDLLATIPNMRRMAPSVAAAELEGTLVLVVDDHPTNRLLLVRQVQALGYAAESAENGVQALAKWNAERFGIVITDCNMPEMDGFELTQSIRRQEAVNGMRYTPIIACTANALGDENLRCLAAGMDDCLVKPVALSQILKVLDQWLPIPARAPVLLPPTTIASEPVDPAPATGPVDRSVLAEISGGNAATERDILTDFRHANDDDALMLEEAVANRDISQVTRATHRMVGASRVVGALEFASVCQRLGHASRAEDLETLALEMAAFHEEYAHLNHYLDTL